MALLQNRPEFASHASDDDVSVHKGQLVCEISDETLQELHRHCAMNPSAAFDHAMSGRVSASLGSRRDWNDGDGSDADILNYALK